MLEEYTEFTIECFEEIRRAIVLAKEAYQFGNCERARELGNDGYTAAFAQYKLNIIMRNYFLERFKSETREDVKKELKGIVDFHSREVVISREMIKTFEGLDELITQEINGQETGE